MRRSGNKVLIIVFIVISLLLIAGGIFAYIYFCTDMFKSEQELFAKYLIQNLEELNETASFNKINEIEEKLKESKYEEDIAISYFETEKTEPTGQVTIKTQNDAINKKTYNVLSLMLEGFEDSLDIEYMGENNIYSLRFTDAVKEFLTIENTNLKQLAKNVGIDEEVIEQIIPDTIDFEKFSFENIKFTEDEKNTEINKYIQLLYNNISEEKYQKIKNTVITVNGKTVTTNAYRLILNMQDIKGLEIKLLETLKQDEIILKKLEKIDEILKEYELESIKESFVEDIEEELDLLNKEKIKEDKNLMLTIYETNRKTVRIRLEQGLNYITLDTTEVNGKRQIDIDITSIDKENRQSTSKATLIKENDNKISIQYSNLDGEEQHSLNLSLESIQNENNTRIDLIIEGEENQITFTRDINIVDEINYNVTLDSSNNIILNDLSSERLAYIFDILGERLNSEYIEPLNEEITSILESIVMYDNIEDLDFSEKEIALFNSKFEVYEGTASAAGVKKLLNIVFTHNVQAATEETERYVRVNGDVTMTENSTSPIEVEGAESYYVECLYGTDGLINQIVITKNEEISLETMAYTPSNVTSIIPDDQDPISDMGTRTMGIFKTIGIIIVVMLLF